MGMGVGGGGGTNTVPSYKTKGEKLTRALVIEDVKIVEIEKQIEVPVIKYVEKEQVVYKDVEQNQTKYITKHEDTTKYIPKDIPTTKYETIVEKTIKYIPEEVKCEKPVLVDKLYEKPVLQEKVYTIVTFQDLEAIQKLIEIVPKMLEDLSTLKTKLDSIRDYKLVEQEIKVPKILYIPTEVERVVWKDVVRERV